MKSLFILQLWLITGITGFSQSISYSYDDSGNRTERSITLKSTSSPDNQDKFVETFEDELGGLDISIYPNPTRGILNIEGLHQEAIGSVFNMNGQMIKSTIINEEKDEISVSELPSGMYILKLSTDKGMVVKRFTKE